jgi:hypothetical protein
MYSPLCPFFFYSLKYSTRGTFLCVVMINPQVVKVFAGLLEEISKQIGGLSSQNTELHVFVRNMPYLIIYQACVQRVQISS